MSKVKVKFEISGMSCNGCASSISRAVGRMEGVEKAEADYSKAIAEIEYDDSIISKDKIIDSIDDLGYKVEGEK